MARMQKHDQTERALITLRAMLDMDVWGFTVKHFADKTGYSKVRMQVIMYELIAFGFVERSQCGTMENGMPVYGYEVTPDGEAFLRIHEMGR